MNSPGRSRQKFYWWYQDKNKLKIIANWVISMFWERGGRGGGTAPPDLIGDTLSRFAASSIDFNIPPPNLPNPKNSPRSLKKIPLLFKVKGFFRYTWNTISRGRGQILPLLKKKSAYIFEFRDDFSNMMQNFRKIEWKSHEKYRILCLWIYIESVGILPRISGPPPPPPPPPMWCHR